MQGRILHYSIQANQGAISGDDGERYNFAGTAWSLSEPPKSGDYVDFTIQDGQADAIYLLPVPRARHTTIPSRGGGTKNRMTATLLAFFLGWFGVHHFYLGNAGRGILHLVLTFSVIGALISGILSLIDCINYISKSDEEFEKSYG